MIHLEFFVSSTGEDFLIHPNWTIQFFMIWFLINHYTCKIQFQRWIIPTITNYALCIMNYHNTHVRASLRGNAPQMCGLPHNYALCIMNYELIPFRPRLKKISTKKGMNCRPSLNLSYVMKSFFSGISQTCIS